MSNVEVDQQRWLEESGQWLENVDRTHLVLASGKPVLQKKISQCYKPNLVPFFLTRATPSRTRATCVPSCQRTTSSSLKTSPFGSTHLILPPCWSSSPTSPNWHQPVTAQIKVENRIGPPRNHWLGHKLNPSGIQLTLASSYLNRLSWATFRLSCAIGRPGQKYKTHGT